MDNNADPRVFMRNDSYIDPRMLMDNSGNMDPRMLMRNSSHMDPRMSIRNSHNMEPMLSRSNSCATDARISRSTSIQNDPRFSTRESIILEERKPFKRNASAKSIKPVNHRKHSCTDVPCLLIFICFITAWIYIASYAFTNGDLNKVLIPVDSKNAKCGLDSGVLNKKKLFYFNLDKCLDTMTPISGCDTKQMCVESCPKKTFIWEDHKTNITALKENLICDDNVKNMKLNTLADIERAIVEESCSGWYIQSKPFFNHCIWDFSSNVCDILSNILTKRKRRSTEMEALNFINTTAITTKFNDFIDSTRTMCEKRNETETTYKTKLEQSNSNLNKIISAVVSKLNYSGSEILAEHVAIDLKNSYKVILIAFVVHIFAVLIFITLLRWLASPLVWISIVGVVTGLSCSLYYSIKEYLHWNKTPHVPQHGGHLLAKFQNVIQNDDLWLYISIIVGAALVIILLILIVIRKRIKIAIALIKEASKAITSIKSSIFFPVFPGILYLIVAILAGIVMLYLSSIGEPEFKMIGRTVDNSTYRVTSEKCICTGPKPDEHYKLGDVCDPKVFEEKCHLKNDVSKPCVETSCSFNEIKRDSKTQWFLLINVFGFLWVTFFISAYEDMVLACTFSIWYWTFNKKEIPKLPLLKAMWITTIYHLGTIAFGSLILSICRMIRYVLELIEKKAKLYNNALTRAIICFMQCFFWCLENFLRFLNRNAYITCAIHSTNFCASSKKAFTLITENILRVYAVDRVSVFLFFLSKILVTGCTSSATYIFLIKYPDVIHVHYPSVPVALVAVSSYVMAHVVFSTYSMAVDTLFFCFLEDSTENDGSMEKPFYMSKQLHKLLGKKQSKRQQIRSDYIIKH